MKNLIDELHKLDEYDFKVSEDFSKKVMKEIKRDKSSNKLTYVISLASIGVVACFALMMFNNSDIKNSFMVAESANMQDSNGEDNISINEIAYNDINKGTNDKSFNSEVQLENDRFFSAENTMQGAMTPEADSFDNKTNGVVSINKDSVDNAFLTDDGLIKELSGDVFAQIEALLTKAEISYEVIDKGIKTKGAKEDIERILKDVIEIVSIEEKDDYIIINKK